HRCASDDNIHGQEMFKTMIQFPNHEHQKGKLADWVRELLRRKSNFVVTCALANKLARIAWALTTRQQMFAS
ncbi:hypothetical protein ACQJ24_28100, partial [Klebsiella variicola subsp. variicola]